MSEQDSLQRRIAAILHEHGPCEFYHYDEKDTVNRHMSTAGAVVAALGLTEETRETVLEHHMMYDALSGGTFYIPTPPTFSTRLVSPWLPVEDSKV